uniref:Uncharacterized protein n=1 Tax=Heterorhabditis bacteriophora TaxID=37862 RepID=A0A1I7X0J6_HETBA
MVWRCFHHGGLGVLHHMQSTMKKENNHHKDLDSIKHMGEVGEYLEDYQESKEVFLAMKSLARSENSAFTPYKRKSSQNTGSSALFTINRACPPLIQPQPRLAVPLALPQEERSDSSIYKKIRGKRKERSSSVGELRY